MKRVKISAIIEVDTLMDRAILEIVIKASIEKVFFIPATVKFLDIQYEDTAAIQESNKSQG